MNFRPERNSFGVFETMGLCSTMFLYLIFKETPKTNRCLFVGYASLSKRNRLIDSIAKIIIESRHVKFIENKFDCNDNL